MLKKQATAIDKPEKVDPRVRRTRHMLQQAMCELLKEKGFAEINVYDITDRADLNRGTFYKHFTDKYDLLNGVVRERFQALLEAALPENPHLSADTMSILIQTAYDYIASFHGSCFKVRSSDEQTLMMQQVQHEIYEILLSWLHPYAAQSVNEHKSTEVTALLTSWTIFGPLVQLTWGVFKLPRQELIDQLKVMVYAMLEDYLTIAS